MKAATGIYNLFSQIYDLPWGTLQWKSFSTRASSQGDVLSRCDAPLQPAHLEMSSELQLGTQSGPDPHHAPRALVPLLLPLYIATLSEPPTGLSLVDANPVQALCGHSCKHWGHSLGLSTMYHVVTLSPTHYQTLVSSHWSRHADAR